MKSIFHIFFFTLLITRISYPQWFPLNSGTGADLNSICFIDSNLAFAAGNGGVVVKTTNGGTTWSVSNISQDNLRGISFSDINHGTVVGDNGKVYRTTDQGINWVPQNSGTSEKLYSVSFANEFTGMAVGHETLIKTTNGGASWVNKTIPIYSWLYGVWMTSPESCTAVGREARVINTSDGGNTWNAQMLSPYRDLLCVHFSDNNNGVIGTIGNSMDPSCVFKTTNGFNWVKLSYTGTTSSFVGIWQSDPDHITAVGENGKIVRTNNGGAQWVVQPSGTTNLLTSVSFIDNYTGIIAGEGGLILKTVNGGSIPVEFISFDARTEENIIVLIWSTATETNNFGFEVERKKQLEGSKWITIGFVKGSGTTTKTNEYSFTDNELETGDYIYRLKQVDLDGSFNYSNEIVISVKNYTYLLTQNFPNPFNPSTSLTYSISEFGKVTIKVFDVLGNEIETLVNEEKPAGNYELTWTATNLPSGVYFYRIQAGNFVQTMKMLLMK